MRSFEHRAEWQAEDEVVGRRAGGARPRRAPRLFEAHGEVQELLGDLGGLVQGIAQAIQELGRAASRLRHAVHEVGEAVGDTLQATRRHGGSALEAADETLRTRPYVAVGIAAALGVVVGYALQRGLAAVEREDGARDGEEWDPSA